MSYTPTYKRPYEQWKELPSKETLVTAEVLTQYDDTFENIEEYLESEGKKEYALVTEAGYSIVASIDEYYVLTVVLKNKAGEVLSTSEPIDLPIESMIINVDYDEESGILTFSLQNGQTLDVNISTLVRGLVPTSRKIAGVDLEDDITVDELKTALGVFDSTVTAGELKPWLYDTENEVEIGVYNGKPVYRKYFTIHVTTTNGLYTQAITDLIPDYEEILNHKMYTTSGNLLNAIYANQGTLDTQDWMCYFVNVGGNIISISRSTSQPELDNDFSFMAEYTKTTDAEGSGNNLNPYGIYDAKLDDVKSSIASVSDEVDAVEEQLKKPTNLFDGSFKFYTSDRSSESANMASIQSDLSTVATYFAGKYCFVHIVFANGIVYEYLGSVVNSNYATFDEISYSSTEKRRFTLKGGKWTVTTLAVQSDIDAINSRLAYKDISSSINVGDMGFTASGYVENGQVVIQITVPSTTSGEITLPGVNSEYAPRVQVCGQPIVGSVDFNKITTAYIGANGVIYFYASSALTNNVKINFIYPLKSS